MERPSARTPTPQSAAALSPAPVVCLFLASALSVTSAVRDAGRGFPTSAGRSVADKVLGTILPLSALAALGLEHIVASLYYLLRAWMLAWFVPE